MPTGCIRRSSGSRSPRGWSGASPPRASVPKSLTPIFRDRHELAASSDLGQTIRAALKQSRFLVVLCSPAAASSRWVNEEILAFKKLHGEKRAAGGDRRRRAVGERDQGPRGRGMLPAGAAREDRPQGPANRQARRADRRRFARGARRARGRQAQAGRGDARAGPRRSGAARAATAAETADLYRRRVARRDDRGQRAGGVRLRQARRSPRPKARGRGAGRVHAGRFAREARADRRLDALDAVGGRALAYFEKQDKTRAERRRAGPTLPGADLDGRDRQHARRL